MAKKTNKKADNRIASNKRALHDYIVEDKFEAGIALSGWEVKSIRAGKASLVDSYVIMKNKEAYLFGSHVQPLTTASTHVYVDPDRTRKLLLHKKELARIASAIEQKGYTCVALSLYWKQHLVKCQIGIARGKKDYDKRQDLKAKDASLEMQRALRSVNKGKFS
jgi:SsrA-binding protein